MTNDFSRRQFLVRASAGATAAWMSVHWTAVVAAAEHARAAAHSAAPPKFEFFTREQGVEIDAMASRIIPTDDTPGAHEAGVVYFIDRALNSFAREDQKTYLQGIPALQAQVREMFPGVNKFSAATSVQQDALLRSLDASGAPSERIFGLSNGPQNFFETVRQHTITAFLVDPEASGDRAAVGWKLIGREQEHMFQSPFGYYDKDYPGWQAAPGGTDKK